MIKRIQFRFRKQHPLEQANTEKWMARAVLCIWLILHVSLQWPWYMSTLAPVIAVLGMAKVCDHMKTYRTQAEKRMLKILQALYPEDGIYDVLFCDYMDGRLHGSTALHIPGNGKGVLHVQSKEWNTQRSIKRTYIVKEYRVKKDYRNLPMHDKLVAWDLA